MDMGYFHILAIMNDVAVSMGVQISVQVPDLNYIFNFLMFHILFSISVTSIYIPTSSIQEFQFLYILSKAWYFLFCFVFG